MSKRETDTEHVGFRCPPDLLKQIDAEVGRLNSERYKSATRTSVIVDLLSASFQARKK